MSDQFDIEHSTVQCEFEPCSAAAGCEWAAVRHAGHDHDIDAGHEDDPPTQTRLPCTDRNLSEHRCNLAAHPRTPSFKSTRPTTHTSSQVPPPPLYRRPNCPPR